MALLKQKIVLKDQEDLKTCSQCSTLEATTDALKKKIQVLQKHANGTHTLVEKNIRTVVEEEKLLDSKIQHFMKRHFERLSSPPKKRKATDDDIEGSRNASKRLKVFHDDENERTKMTSLEKGVVTIQQSIERMERKSFRKNIILIGLCGALKFMYGASE
jgi:hypothetical protein